MFFALLHSFYGALGEIIFSELSGDEEKNVLFTEVTKFNEFKADISQEKSESSPVRKVRGAGIDQDKPVLTAQGHGQRFQFNEDTEVSDQDEESNFFSDVNSRLAAVFDGIDEQQVLSHTAESALAGVNVETEDDDDSDEEVLSYEGGTIAPALGDAEEESSFSVNRLAKEQADAIENDAQQTRKTERVFPPGLDVETEADDDSDEEAFPMKDGELAPALSGSEEGLNFDKYRNTEGVADTESADLVNRLDSFFGDEAEDSSDELSLEEGHALSVAEEVPAGLSFLDEEVPAPTFTETSESPAALNIEVPEEESAGGALFP